MTAAADTLVLLVNTGSPAEPTPAALKTYLAEFLGDRRLRFFGGRFCTA